MGPEGTPSTPEINPVAPPPVPPTPGVIPTPAELRPQLGVPDAGKDNGIKASLPDISPPGNNGEVKPPALPQVESGTHIGDNSNGEPKEKISEDSRELPPALPKAETGGLGEHIEEKSTVPVATNEVISEKSGPDGPPAPPVAPSVETKKDNPDQALIDRIVSLATKDAETELAQRMEDAKKLDLGEDHIKQIETGRRERIHKIAEERRTEFAAAIESARTAVQEAMVGDNTVERAFSTSPEDVRRAQDLRLALDALTKDDKGEPRVAALQIGEMHLPGAKSKTGVDMQLIHIQYNPGLPQSAEIETEKAGTEK